MWLQLKYYVDYLRHQKNKHQHHIESRYHDWIDQFMSFSGLFFAHLSHGPPEGEEMGSLMKCLGCGFKYFSVLMFYICGFRITKLCWLWVLENWQFCSNKKESWTKNKQIVNTLCWTYLTFYFFLSTKEILPLFRSVYQHQPEYILW